MKYLTLFVILALFFDVSAQSVFHKNRSKKTDVCLIGGIGETGETSIVSGYKDSDYTLELLPGIAFTGSWYYWVNETSGNSSTANLTESPEVEWLMVSPAQFTDFADGLATQVNYSFITPTEPGTYTTQVVDLNGNWSTMFITLVVTENPTQNSYVFEEVLFANELYELNRWVKCPPYFYWSEENLYYYITQMEVNHLEYPEKTWFNIEPSSLVLFPSDSINVNYSAFFTELGSDSILIYKEMKNYTRPTYYRFIFNVILEMPQNLIVTVSGHDVNLSWNPPSENPLWELLGYNIYRDNTLAGFTVDTYYTDFDVSAGSHQYQVSAMYDEGESELTPEVSVLVGAANILVNPVSFEERLNYGTSITREMIISNNGDLPLQFDIGIEANRKINSELQNPSKKWDQLFSGLNAKGLNLSGNHYVPDTIIHTDQNSELEKFKMSRIQQNEQAPGTYPGPLSYTDVSFDLQFEYAVDGVTYPGQAGIETDGEYIFTSDWQTADAGKFYAYSLTGSFLGQITVAGLTGIVGGIRDLAYDGTYFYGSPATTTCYQFSLNGATLTGTLISSWVASTVIRAIAYSTVDDGFWANNWSTTITLFSRTGATVNTMPTVGDESYYGFAWDPQGPYLWGYSLKTGTSQNMLYKLAIPGGAVIESFDVLTVLTLAVTGDIAGGAFFRPNLIQGYYTLGGLVQNKCIWGLEMGTTGPPSTIDVGVQAFVSPVSGIGLGNEPVKITVKNFGTNSVGNIPVSYTLDGGSAVNGTIAGTLASGATADFTFPGTVTLSNPGQNYEFVGCTALADDANTGNNCKTYNVTNIIPSYCTASTTTEDEYISNVLFGSINNSSGWQGGVSDYTAISTTMEPSATEAITVTNGTPWDSDKVTVWVDWNKDYTFGAGTNEEFVLTNVGGTGASFTGVITVPEEQTSGEYRMRIRMTYSNAPLPCGNANYGEIEDYTLIVIGWLAINPWSGTILPGESETVEVTFDATNLTPNIYTTNININSNDPDTPIISVPVTLEVYQNFIRDTIPLNVGWNLISLDVIPQANTPANVFETLIGENKLLYVSGFQNQEGVFFDPYGPDFLNTLINMNPSEGYWVKVNAACSLIVEGTPIPTDFMIGLQFGWNLISYWPQDPMRVDSTFQELISLGILLSVSTFYDSWAYFFDPNGPPWLMELFDVKNGMGLWVKLNQSYSGFSYPNNN